MIRRLRARHRRWIVVLALAILVLAVIGLRSRRATPRVDTVPSELTVPTGGVVSPEGTAP